MIERFNRSFLKNIDSLSLPAALVMIANEVTEYFRSRDDKLIQASQLNERLDEIEQQVIEANDKAGRALASKQLGGMR